jgi:hypothetical protein
MILVDVLAGGDGRGRGDGDDGDRVIATVLEVLPDALDGCRAVHVTDAEILMPPTVLDAAVIVGRDREGG